MKIPLMGIATGVLGGRSPIQYLLLDEFSTAENAPMVTPRSCEPGPGSFTVGNECSISGGNLVTGGAGLVLQSTTSFAHQPGLCVFSKNVAAVSAYQRFGFFASGYGNGMATMLGSEYAVSSGNRIYGAFPLYTAHTRPVFIIRRESGGTFLVIGNRLFFVDPTINLNPLYVAITETSGNTLTTSRIGLTKLGSPWDTDFGVVTERKASASVGDTITSESNAFIEATWAAVTGETYELSVRRTSDENRWIVRCNQSAGTIKLIQCEGGVETERDSDACTFNDGTSYRIYVNLDGITITTHVGNNAYNSYASASFNQSATGVKTSHAVTELAAYPKYLSGAALAALVAVEPSINP